MNISLLLMLQLSLMVRDGQGGERDPGKALQIFEEMCQKGESSGCANAMVMYEGGHGVEVEKEKAGVLKEKAGLLKGKACELGLVVYCGD